LHRPVAELGQRRTLVVVLQKREKEKQEEKIILQHLCMQLFRGNSQLNAPCTVRTLYKVLRVLRDGSLSFSTNLRIWLDR
jgi:hypothetical protein